MADHAARYLDCLSFSIFATPDCEIVETVVNGPFTSRSLDMVG
jgi:hypothetical protein